MNNETLTSCIVHLADSANLKGVTSNKLCNGLTDSCFESPNDTIHVTVGAAMGVVLLPVAAIDKGAEGVKEWAVSEAILIGISVPPIFIGTRKTKYDLENKWILKTGK